MRTGCPRNRIALSAKSFQPRLIEGVFHRFVITISGMFSSHEYRCNLSVIYWSHQTFHLPRLWGGRLHIQDHLYPCVFPDRTGLRKFAGSLRSHRALPNPPAVSYRWVHVYWRINKSRFARGIHHPDLHFNPHLGKDKIVQSLIRHIGGGFGDHR